MSKKNGCTTLLSKPFVHFRAVLWQPRKMTAKANDESKNAVISYLAWARFLSHKHPGQIQFYKALSSASPWLLLTTFICISDAGRSNLLNVGSVILSGCFALCSCLIQRPIERIWEYRVKTAKNKLQPFAKVLFNSAVKSSSVSRGLFSLLLKKSRLRYFADAIPFHLPHYYLKT